MKLELIHYCVPGNIAKYGSRFLARVLKFCERYDGDARPDVIWATLSAAMTAQSPHHMLLAAIDDNGEIVGHLVAEITNFYGEPAVFIQQLEFEKSARDGRKEVIAEGLKRLDDWGVYHGVGMHRIWARNEAVAKRFELLGFTRRPHILMERPVQRPDEEQK